MHRSVFSPAPKPKAAGAPGSRQMLCVRPQVAGQAGASVVRRPCGARKCGQPSR
jgi:hypothetical protein